MQKTVIFVGAAVLLIAGVGLAIAAGGPSTSGTRSTTAIVTQLPVATLTSPEPTAEPTLRMGAGELETLRKIDKADRSSSTRSGGGASGSTSSRTRRGRESAEDDDEDREVVTPSIRDEDESEADEEEDEEEDESDED